jgi:acetyltransferase-like isoleucine patch superfamily enzyme
MNDAEAYVREGLINNTKVSIGKFTYGSSGLTIKNYDNPDCTLSIGNFTSIGANSTILIGGEHSYKNFTTYPFNHPRFIEDLGGDGVSWKSKSKGNIVIGNDVWIGFGSTISSGVTIGDGAVIGMCSVIVHDIEPFSVIAGNPAKIIKYRFRKKIRELLLELSWWNLENETIKEISKMLFNEVPDEKKINDLIDRFRK